MEINFETISMCMQTLYNKYRHNIVCRECDEQSFYMPVEDPRQCIGQCAEAPVCGRQTIPENHLKV